MRFINPKGKWDFTKIKEEWNTPRSYVLETPDERSFHRNRRHMFLTKEQVSSTNVIESPPVIPRSCESSDSPTSQQTPRENVNPTGSNIAQTRCGRTVKPPEFLVMRNSKLSEKAISVQDTNYTSTLWDTIECCRGFEDMKYEIRSSLNFWVNFLMNVLLWG